MTDLTNWQLEESAGASPEEHLDGLKRQCDSRAIEVLRELVGAMFESADASPGKDAIAAMLRFAAAEDAAVEFLVSLPKAQS